MKYYFGCPRCKQDEEFVKVRDRGGGLGCLMFLTGGIFPYLLFSMVRAGRVQCTKCLEIFRPPAMPTTGTSKLAAAVGILIVLFVIAMLLVFAIPDSDTSLADVPAIKAASQVISQHAHLIALAVPAFLAMLLVICMFVAAVSNGRARAHLRKKFLSAPTALPRRAERSAPKEPARPEQAAQQESS